MTAEPISPGKSKQATFGGALPGALAFSEMSKTAERHQVENVELIQLDAALARALDDLSQAETRQMAASEQLRTICPSVPEILTNLPAGKHRLGEFVICVVTMDKLENRLTCTSLKEAITRFGERSRTGRLAVAMMSVAASYEAAVRSAISTSGKAVADERYNEARMQVGDLVSKIRNTRAIGWAGVAIKARAFVAENYCSPDGQAHEARHREAGDDLARAVLNAAGW